MNSVNVENAILEERKRIEEEASVVEEREFLKGLYITSPSMSPEQYSDSVTELECFQDGFDDAQSQINGKIRGRLEALTPPNYDVT